ncbi:carbohydrate ABC transporter permease [Paenibacillus lycopersici]|uniref:Carbohydrate ABC transporter permease n=1 Tax=Paenibacillus lycopersici TaxID=2704462 RepID=A0A6C0FZ97_9BACL|nr:carbohydrate ABC transporter permease [Paenibacillus lycopersici]QHT62458.1 carbohydrate ABC transporter permease [Paenibacillus lycopersici]
MRKSSASGIVFNCVNVIIMLAIVVATVYPFLYILSYSFSTASRMTGGLMLFPEGFNLDSYRIALGNPAIVRSAVVSAERTILGPLVMIFITSMAAYCITRDEMIGVRYVRRFFVFTMYFSSGLIPSYMLVKNLGMIGSFWVYIIPSAVNVFSMILIKTYIESVPKSMEEAAIVDGANDFKLYWQVIFPVCTPVIAAVVLFSAVEQWNSFVDTQIYNTMYPKLYTLQYVLYQTLSGASSLSQVKSQAITGTQSFVSPQTLKMAITIITVIPIMFVYPFLQKHFTKGLLIGSVKG